MRSRFRSESSPSAARQGRPLELVRVRGTQRHPGSEGREVRGRRRRGGRGRNRGPRPPLRPAQRPSLWAWLKNLFQPATGRPGSPAEAARSASLGEQEARVIAEFQRHYKLTFNDPELLKLALTHRSYLSVTGEGPRASNERLEFLGDSVLGLVTSDYLFSQHPNEHEGQLTKTKSLLVSKAILSRRGLAMGLGRFVLMSHSEIESGGRQRLSIIADAFESVIGAIYLDLGFEAAREFIQRWLLRDYREIAADKRHTNYKSHLQEYVQSTFRTHPVYRIRSEMGPDHSKQFMVEVMVGRRTLGTGRGRNKKEAEQAAARDALEKVQERPSERGPDAGRMTEPEYREPREGREPRDMRESREPRGTREPRAGREGRATAGPAPAAEAAPEMEMMPEVEPAPATTDAGFARPEAEGAEGEGARRRRGRRGGRGRRGRADEAAQPGRGMGTGVAATAERAGGTPEAEAHAPVRPAPPPGDDARRTRVARVARAFEPRLPEVEPLPPAYEEDENEEIGRPEGPLEERHVDPYAVEPEPGSPRFAPVERGRGRSVEPGYLMPARSEPEPEDEWSPALEPLEDEPGAAAREPEPEAPAREDDAIEADAGFDAGPEAEPDPGFEPPASATPDDEAAPPRDEPRFGRRPGRSRRGR